MLRLRRFPRVRRVGGRRAACGPTSAVHSKRQCAAAPPLTSLMRLRPAWIAGHGALCHGQLNDDQLVTMGAVPPILAKAGISTRRSAPAATSCVSAISSFCLDVDETLPCICRHCCRRHGAADVGTTRASGKPCSTIWGWSNTGRWLAIAGEPQRLKKPRCVRGGLSICSAPNRVLGRRACRAIVSLGCHRHDGAFSRSRHFACCCSRCPRWPKD